MTNNDTKQIETLKKQGLAQLKDNKLEAAKALYTQICNIDPADRDAWYTLSNINGMLGNIDEAGECCRRVLALQPDHCEAHINLGNVLLSQGKHAEAAEQYQKALQIDPNHAVAHSNFGNALFALGNYDAAASSYQAAIQLNPNLFIAYYNLGNLRMLQGEYGKAVNNYNKSLLLNPSDVQFNGIKEQGHALLHNGRLEEAKALFTHLCQVKPDDAEAWHTLSIIHGKLGAMDEASDCCRRVLAIQPDHVEAHIHLGHVLLHQGRLDEAITQYEHAVKINPQSIPALNNLGKACKTEEQFKKYVERYHKAISLLPDPAEARNLFINLMKKRPLSEYDPRLDEELQKYFINVGVDDKSTSFFTARHLKLKYRIQPPIDYDRDALLAKIEQIASDALFLSYLEKTINLDVDIELLLTKIRRELLFNYCREKAINQSEIGLIAALAFQCLNNEYVFVIDEEENRQIAALKHDIEQSAPSIIKPDEYLEYKLLVYGMYERLYSLSCREHLSHMPFVEWSKMLRPLLEQTLINPIEEDIIKREIPQITYIEDQTSQRVQSQYEENPYPRWVSIPNKGKNDLDVGAALKQHFPHFTPPSFLDGQIQVLVAGCGTGKHPIQVALSYKNADVLAVDISKSSLAYAVRMARKFNVKNIQFMQGDILQLSKLNRRFHIIECSGVLHHMEDPIKGWRALANLLVKNGLMYVGLYSEKARADIVAAREIIKNEKLSTDRNTIRNFRARILRRELGDAIFAMSRSSPDFFSTSGCRDLLFHFKEHRFTLPQINDALNELHLKFIGFVVENSGVAANINRDHLPKSKDITNLLCWDMLENIYPDFFERMYQFWCQNKNGEN